MHRIITQYKKGAEIKRQLLAAEEEREVISRALSAYGCLLEMVTSFTQLGQVISVADDYCLAVVRNLAKSLVVWQRLAGIIIREGAASQGYGYLFKAVIQSVLFLSLETWVITPRMGRVLGGFQNLVARWLTERLPQRGAEKNENKPWRRQERGGRIRGDGRIHSEKAEHSRTVHIFAITSGPV